MGRWWIAALLALSFAVPARGDDNDPSRPPAPKPPDVPVPPTQETLTPEQAADSALLAWSAKDPAALKALAAKDDPDPWLVADALLARDESDAADAFAKAAPRKDVERLPAYVASRRGKPDDAAARRGLATANAAFAARKPRQALEALGPPDAEPPTDVVGIRRAFARGMALAASGRLEESAGAYLSVAGAAERAGWLARASKSLHEAGMSAVRRADYRGALSAWDLDLGMDEARGDRAGVAATLGNIGLVHSSLGSYAKALEYQERALKMKEELGDRAVVATTLGNIGNIHASLGSYAKALEIQERALKMMEELGDRAAVATTLGNIGLVHASLGSYAKALEYHERALAMKEELGDRAGVALTLGNLGNVHAALGSYAKALEYQERALEMAEQLRDRAGVARTLGNIGLVHASLGGYAKALEVQERALKMKEELGDRAGVAATLGNIGLVHSALGSYAKALEVQERALKMKEALGDRAGVALTLGNIGNLHSALGSYAKAIEYHERALAMEEELGDRAGVAMTLGNIGNVHAALGNLTKALEVQERALKMKEELGDRAGSATTLGNIGLVHAALGSYAKALEVQERALRMKEALGDRAGVAMTLGNVGNVHDSLRDHAKALEAQERALEVSEGLGDRAGVARALGNIGNVHRSLRSYPKALEYGERALAHARDMGERDVIVRGLWSLAQTHLARGAPAEAARQARDAVEQMSVLVAGLAEEQGASAREQFDRLFAIGAQAASSLGDATGVSFFLESGRAGTLLEGLGGRTRLRGQLVPEGLRRAESTAGAREAAALARYRRALDRGDVAEIRRSRGDLDAARAGVVEAIERIQREAKRAGSVLYPKADALEAIQGRLGPGEALVSFGLFSKEALALVVTPKEARIVALPPTAEIGAAVAGLEMERRDSDAAAPLAALRKAVVEPLALGKEVKRVLLSPEGALSYVPFAALFDGYDIDVAYEPSGTTYGVLLEDAAKKGDGILALGDPDYQTRVDERALGVVRGGLRLVPLPGTRDEVEALGTQVLLGAQASEAGLRGAVAGKPRWRAVHLACHGLVDPEHPAFSSLALTADRDDDGFLTVLEVFRSQIPADLVVLSACETAKGKIFRGEGIMGLTRAFMYAGSPRVICSLWKVDDDATRALMTKFYELWNPKDGTPGVPTAEALRKAQAFIRSQERWKHPYYWAAWVLWGLPS